MEPALKVPLRLLGQGNDQWNNDAHCQANDETNCNAQPFGDGARATPGAAGSRPAGLDPAAESAGHVVRLVETLQERSVTARHSRLD